jgi:hypothetical protein
MTIDDYLTGIERGLRQNVHITSTLGQLTDWLPLISRL